MLERTAWCYEGVHNRVMTLLGGLPWEGKNELGYPAWEEVKVKVTDRGFVDGTISKGPSVDRSAWESHVAGAQRTRGTWTWGEIVRSQTMARLYYYPKRLWKPWRGKDKTMESVGEIICSNQNQHSSCHMGSSGGWGQKILLVDLMDKGT